MYLLLKSAHVGLALTSVGLLLWRLWHNWQHGYRRTPRWMHGIDALLLASAGLLVWQGMPWPLPHWMQLKLVLLVLYVVLAAQALRRPPGTAKALFSLTCLLCIASVLTLARLKPFGL